MEKNIFEKIAKNLFVSRRPKSNLRCNLNFRYIRSYIEDVVGHKLKSNKSYFSLFIGNCEVFLGEVNYDISSIPMGKFYNFEQYFTWCVTKQLKEFVETCDKELVEKLQDRIKDGDYTLRYIVKDDTAGCCLSLKCRLNWRYDDPLFALKYCYVDNACFGLEWLDYWYNRKRYFAD